MSLNTPSFSPSNTDVLYSAHSPTVLEELDRALGHDQIYFVTVACLTPERLFLHACLNTVVCHLAVHESDEMKRAAEIAHITDTMYRELLPAFKEKIATSEARARLETRSKDADAFLTTFLAKADLETWNAESFHNLAHTDRYAQRWKQKTLESYARIRSRVESGDYVPSDHWDTARATSEWVQMNLEYKHYRDIGRTLTESYMESHFPLEERITYHPARERETIFFVGGMGSGKTEMTKHYLAGLPANQQHDLMLRDNDVIKAILFQHAKEDGKLSATATYDGRETHRESSNVLYESYLKLGYYLHNQFEGPHVVRNSIALDPEYIEQGLTFGGKVTIHHIHMQPKDAIEETRIRAEQIGRMPKPEETESSILHSARRLDVIADDHFKGSDIVLHLYAREQGKAPQHYATLDRKNGRLEILDTEKLTQLALAQNPSLSKDEALTAFIDKWKDKGVVASAPLAASADNLVALTTTPLRRSL